METKLPIIASCYEIRRTIHLLKNGYEIWKWLPEHNVWQFIERYQNRGHALSALKGLQNPRVRKVRYTFRKVYLYLQAHGWRLDLSTDGGAYWRSPGGSFHKENRQLGPRSLLLTLQESIGFTAKSIVESYSEWLDSQQRQP
jgi:hypothetical protein